MSLTTTVNTVPELLLSDGVFEGETFTATGALTFPVGLILARLASSGKLQVYVSGAADGTEFPLAVLTKEHITTGSGDTVIRPLISGRIRSDQLLVWTGGSPVAPDIGERDLLRDFTIVSQPDRELLRADNT